jgi:hypothetical protein
LIRAEEPQDLRLKVAKSAEFAIDIVFEVRMMADNFVNEFERYSRAERIDPLHRPLAKQSSGGLRPRACRRIYRSAAVAFEVFGPGLPATGVPGRIISGWGSPANKFGHAAAVLRAHAASASLVERIGAVSLDSIHATRSRSV